MAGQDHARNSTDVTRHETARPEAVLAITNESLFDGLGTVRRANGSKLFHHTRGDAYCLESPYSCYG